MKKLVFFTILLLFTQIIKAAEVLPVQMPVEVTDSLIDTAVSDPEVKDLKWLRWTSDSFVVCSLNDEQAQYLVANLENIKKWIYTRWGFDNFDFTTECRLICVDDPALFEKCFGLKESKVEVKYNDKKKPELYVIFYLLDKKPSQTIPVPLTKICLDNLDQIYDIKSPFWSVSGMSQLNRTIPDIVANFENIDQHFREEKAMYFTESVTKMTADQYKELDAATKKLYDENSMAFCLFLRKKYGQNKFHRFYWHCAKGNNPQLGLFEIYGFKNYDHADSFFKDFLKETSEGVRSGEIRRNYLQVSNSSD